MKSNKGRTVPNQYVMRLNNCNVFQSYETVIAIHDYKENVVYLNEDYYDYSRTTARYRNKFFDLTTKEIKEKIKEKQFLLTPHKEMESRFKFVLTQ